LRHVLPIPEMHRFGLGRDLFELRFPAHRRAKRERLGDLRQEAGFVHEEAAVGAHRFVPGRDKICLLSLGDLMAGNEPEQEIERSSVLIRDEFVRRVSTCNAVVRLWSSEVCVGQPLRSVGDHYFSASRGLDAHHSWPAGRGDVSTHGVAEDTRLVRLGKKVWDEDGSVSSAPAPGDEKRPTLRSSSVFAHRSQTSIRMEAGNCFSSCHSV
jgi:hypothetical protein